MSAVYGKTREPRPRVKTRYEQTLERQLKEAREELDKLRAMNAFLNMEVGLIGEELDDARERHERATKRLAQVSEALR